MVTQIATLSSVLKNARLGVVERSKGRMLSMGFRYGFLVFLAVIFTLPPFAVMAQEEKTAAVMRAADIARAAYAINPALQAARAALRGAQELDPQARANFHPWLGVSAGVTASDVDNSNFGAGDGDTTKDLTVELNQPLYRGGRSTAQKDEAKNRIAGQKAALLAEEQRILSAAILAGLDAVYARKMAQLQRENEGLYRNLLSAVEKRRAGGETTDTELYLASNRLARAMADRMEAETAIGNADTRVEELTGSLPGDWQDAALPALAFPKTASAALDIARTDNPAILQYGLLTGADMARIKMVRGELLPDIGLYASWNRQWDPQPGIIDESEVSQAGIEATVPLYEGGAVRSRIRAAKQALAEHTWNARDIRLQVERAVITDWRLMENARAQKSIRQDEAAAAWFARQNLEREVFAGEKTLTDLLQADRDWLDARVSLIDTEHAERAAFIRVAAHLALLTPENLGFADEAYDKDAYLKRVRNKVLSENID